MVQGEEKLKESAQAYLERNRQWFERKKETGFDLAVSLFPGPSKVLQQRR